MLLVLVDVFDHDPQQRLGPRRPDHHPAVVAETFLDGGHVGSEHGRGLGVAGGQGHVSQQLGHRGHDVVGQHLQRCSSTGDHVEELHTGQRAVAGGGQVAADHVTRLLTAQ